MTRNVALRAALTAVALVLLLVPAAVVLGGYMPAMPGVGRFGSFLVSDLPYVAFLAIGSVGLVGIAVAIGGGRWTRLLGALGLVVVLGIVVAGAALARTLSDNGASYDVLRHIQVGPTQPPREATERRVFATVDGTELKADVWLPFHALDKPAPPSPAVVYVHGGGFVGGRLGMRPDLVIFLVNQGYVVLDVEYRLAPPPRWQDAPADVLCALAWAGAYADDFGIDPARVTIMGESAGGNLALVAGYAAGTEAIDPSCDGEPILPRGVIAVAPAIDMEAIWSNPTLWYEGRPLPEAYIGGPPSQYPDRYAAAAPFAYVRPDLPPTLLVAAANDRIITLDQVRRLEAALRAAGAEVDLIVMPFADHGFDGSHRGPAGQLLEDILPGFIGDVGE